MGEAVSWYKKAADQGNSWAAYRLGKLYLEGKNVPKDMPKAVAYLTESARQGNQYAQYALGKLYLTGQDVKQDREQAWAYFYESAEQGNEYAAFFLEHFDQAGRPNDTLENAIPAIYCATAIPLRASAFVGSNTAVSR